MNPMLHKLLAAACFVIAVICGIACAFFTFHNGQQFQDWVGAGLISAGVGGLLLVLP